jgi:hypothetical protein
MITAEKRQRTLRRLGHGRAMAVSTSAGVNSKPAATGQRA